MTWLVTYRGKDGEQKQLSLEAESRDSVFAELKKNGVSAIRIEQASGKVRSRAGHGRWRAGSLVSRHLIKGSIVGLAVIAVAVGAWYFITRGSEDVEPGKERKSKNSAKSVKVKPTPDAPVKVAPDPEPLKIDPNARPTKVGEEVNGYVMLPNGKMHRRRGIRTVEPGGVDRSHPAAIFDHSTDNEFAVILTLQPGESLIGGPIRHGKNYEEMFRKSLETPIIVSKDDPDDVQALKRAVIETRLAMKDALDRGEDIKKIVDEAYVEAQKLSLYKETLREQINEAVRNGDMTDDDLDDLVSAANKMLESKGIAPMKFGALTRARIRNLKK